jgi:hypothetical protein
MGRARVSVCLCAVIGMKLGFIVQETCQTRCMCRHVRHARPQIDHVLIDDVLLLDSWR